MISPCVFRQRKSDKFLAFIEITNSCNMKCKHCMNWSVQNSNVCFEKNQILKLINELYENNTEEIYISGGEPLLYPYIDEVILYANSLGIKVTLATNALEISNHLDAIKKGVQLVSISLDGIGETHDKFRGVDGAFENCVEMFKLLKKNNIKTRISAMIWKENYEQHVYISLDGPTFEDNVNRIYGNKEYMYPDIIKGINLLREYNVPFGIFMVATKETIHKAKDMILELDEKYSPTRIGYNLPHWTPDYNNISLAEEFRDVMLELYKNRKQIKAEIPQLNWRLNPICDGKIKKFSCGLHTTQKTILPDKSIIRCSKIDNENDNLKTIVTDELLDKSSPIELSKNVNSSCSNCIALASCGGGCPFDGMKRFNCLTDKRECIITPPLISNAINNVVKNFEEQNIKVPNGLIEPNIIKKLLWG